MFGQQQVHVHVYQTYLLTVRIHFLLLAFLLFSFFCFDFILNKTKDNEQINIINLKNEIYLKFDLALDHREGLVSLTNDKSTSYYAAQNKNKFTCILMTWHIYIKSSSFISSKKYTYLSSFPHLNYHLLPLSNHHHFQYLLTCLP